MEHKYLSNKKIRIYYEIEKKDVVIVYLHGAGCNHTVFNHYRDYFRKKGLGSLALDQRGNGKSTYPASKKEYTLERYVSDLSAVAEKEKIKSMILVGHSMGTIVAQQYALEHSDKVKALALISPSYNFKKTFERNFFRKTFLDVEPLSRQLLTRYNQVKGLVNFKRKEYYPDFSQERFTEMSDWEFLKETYRENTFRNIRLYHKMSHALMKWDLKDKVSRIKCPVLLIHGTRDQLVPIRTVYELYEMIPQAEKPVIIPDLTHSLIFKCPKLIIQAMDEFLLKYRYFKPIE